MEYIPTIPPLSHYLINICLYLANNTHKRECMRVQPKYTTLESGLSRHLDHDLVQEVVSSNPAVAKNL